MEAFFNTDTSFFEVSLSTGVNITTDVVSFSITEEIGLLTKGNIQLHDPNYYHSLNLPFNATFSLKWGYKKRNDNTLLIDLQRKNPGEMISSNIRDGMRCIIQAPAWSLGNDGRIIYNASFIAEEFQANLKNQKVYKDNNRFDVIRKALSDLGAKQFFIDFRNQKENLSELVYVRQAESTFKFLVRLAYEWNCVFHLGRDQKGNLLGMFIDQTKMNSNLLKTYQRLANGSIGNSKLLEYGLGATRANVISATVQRHIGDSGQGDNININIIDGKTVLTRYSAEEKRQKTIKINETRLKEYINTHGENEAEITQQIISAKKLSSQIGDKTVKYFFDDVESVTAPQGLGYSANIQLLGDPSLSPTIEIKFGEGFPDDLKNTQNDYNRFYIKSATHNLSSAGYRTSIIAGDTINAFKSFVRT